MRKITKLYKVWAGMKGRCNNPRNTSYNIYGGRGISYYKDWESFENFEKWSLSNGYSEGLTIDRINSDGNYCPDNCRFVNRKVQNNNKRDNIYVTLHGETKTFQQWCDLYHINSNTVRSRIRKFGYSIEEALTKNPKKGTNLTGKRFAKLVVIGYVPSPKHRGRLALCKCDCGNVKAIRPDGLTSGNIKSCGCYFRETRKVFANKRKREKDGTFSKRQ